MRSDAAEEWVRVLREGGYSEEEVRYALGGAAPAAKKRVTAPPALGAAVGGPGPEPGPKPVAPAAVEAAAPAAWAGNPYLQPELVQARREVSRQHLRPAWQNFTVPELKKECIRRGFPATQKGEMVRALEKHGCLVSEKISKALKDAIKAWAAQNQVPGHGAPKRKPKAAKRKKPTPQVAAGNNPYLAPEEVQARREVSRQHLRPAWQNFTVPELKKECIRRGFPATRKVKMVADLEAHGCHLVRAASQRSGAPGLTRWIQGEKFPKALKDAIKAWAKRAQVPGHAPKKKSVPGEDAWCKAMMKKYRIKPSEIDWLD